MPLFGLISVYGADTVKTSKSDSLKKKKDTYYDPFSEVVPKLSITIKFPCGYKQEARLSG